MSWVLIWSLTIAGAGTTVSSVPNIPSYNECMKSGAFMAQKMRAGGYKITYRCVKR